LGLAISKRASLELGFQCENGLLIFIQFHPLACAKPILVVVLNLLHESETIWIDVNGASDVVISDALKPADKLIVAAFKVSLEEVHNKIVGCLTAGSELVELLFHV